MEIVRPGNCLVYAWDQKWGELSDQDEFLHEDDWSRIEAELLPILALTAEADVQFINDLVAYDWPEVVEADVEGLIREISEDASWAEFYSQVQSWTEFVEYPAGPATPSAAVIRAKLGLESNIGMVLEPCEGA